jgi:hypothetical protein
MKSSFNVTIITIVAALAIVLISGIPKLNQEIRDQNTIKDELLQISGLDCDEITDYFKNGRNCSGVSPHLACKYPKSTRQNILYMMILKNCTGSGYLYWK